MDKEITEAPIFFERNRVFRVYKGGKLFHDFFGDEAEDSNYPEEWIASMVEAKNKISRAEREGVSRIEGTDIFFDDVARKYPQRLFGPDGRFDVLVKILDSAVRLPVQAHPDREFSSKYFNSSFGKTEAWLILATRENAKIYFGFKSRITEDEFSDIVERAMTEQGIMEQYLNEIPVNSGEVYLIPAKMVHAIGSGCLILEVQEPTDFTIQPEKWCGDYELDDYEMFLGLGKKTALTCFDYNIYGQEAAKMGKKTPKVLCSDQNAVKEQLVGKEDTPCFALNRYTVHSGSAKLGGGPAVYVVTEGRGFVKTFGFEREIKKGDYFFLPYCAKNCIICTDNVIQIAECKSFMKK